MAQSRLSSAQHTRQGFVCCAVGGEEESLKEAANRFSDVRSRAVYAGRMEERKLMRRRIAMLIMAATVATTMVAGPVGAAFGAEHHPPKFHPKSKQCSGSNNHPNCPGKH